MATVKINCPNCIAEGLTGSSTLSVCSQCKGVGTIPVNDQASLSTLSATSTTPIVVTAPVVPSISVASVKLKGK